MTLIKTDIDINCKCPVSLEDHADGISSAKRRVKDETLENEDLKKSRVEDQLDPSEEDEEAKCDTNGSKVEAEEPDERRAEEDLPPPPEEYIIGMVTDLQNTHDVQLI